MYEDDVDKLQQRILTGLQSRRLLVYKSDWTSRTGLAYWLGFLRHDPGEFAYVVPRRLACRVLQRHNPTCVGRLNHPRRW